MPMYLDRHDAPGITPEELAEAHNRDVDVQDKYGVRYHTYWFDPQQGTVFCLAEGPSEQAVVGVHEEAHGQIPSAIIELDPTAPLNAVFGALPTYPVGTAYTAPAMRAIVFTDVCGSVAQVQQLGDDGHMQMLRAHNDIVRRALETHGGREVKHTGDGIMAAFTSVSAAVEFAVSAQRGFDEHSQDLTVPLEVSIGISAGEPVTDDNDDLFGAAVQLAARLCAAAGSGEIAVSTAVRELAMGKRIVFEDRGVVALKGLSEPVQVFAVPWRL
jgi:class 3 adenylate cyclase